jgi:hypothetical protein
MGGMSKELICFNLNLHLSTVMAVVQFTLCLGNSASESDGFDKLRKVFQKLESKGLKS